MRVVMVVDVIDEDGEDMISDNEALFDQLKMSKVIDSNVLVALRTEHIEIVLGQGVVFKATLVDVERAI